MMLLNETGVASGSLDGSLDVLANNSTSAQSNKSLILDNLDLRDIIIGLIFFAVLCICAKPEIPSIEARRRAQERRNLRRSRRHRKCDEKTCDPNTRKEMIRQSLTVQIVAKLDSNGHLTLSDPNEHLEDNVKCQTDKNRTGGKDSSVCVICLEPFHVGDCVAWSHRLPTTTNPQCQHVFHHECIVSWLLSPRHDDCPSCRSTILYFDVEAGNAHHSENNHAASNSTYMIVNGLVSLARNASSSLCQTEGKSDKVSEDNSRQNPSSGPSPVRQISDSLGMPPVSLTGPADSMPSASNRDPHTTMELFVDTVDGKLSSSDVAVPIPDRHASTHTFSWFTPVRGSKSIKRSLSW